MTHVNDLSRFSSSSNKHLLTSETPKDLPALCFSMQILTLASLHHFTPGLVLEFLSKCTCVNNLQQETVLQNSGFYKI